MSIRVVPSLRAILLTVLRLRVCTSEGNEITHVRSIIYANAAAVSRRKLSRLVYTPDTHTHTHTGQPRFSCDGRKVTSVQTTATGPIPERMYNVCITLIVPHSRRALNVTYCGRYITPYRSQNAKHVLWLAYRYLDTRARAAKISISIDFRAYSRLRFQEPFRGVHVG